MTIDEAVEAFREEYKKASETTDKTLKWAVFPTGDKETERQAAQYLMSLFDNLNSFIFISSKNEDEVIEKLEEALKELKGRKAKLDLKAASEKAGYELHTGQG